MPLRKIPQKIKADLVVTQHPELVVYLLKRGMIDPDTPVISHASEEDTRDKVVVGVLPMKLAALAKAVYEVDLDIPPEKKGARLSEEEIEQYAKGIVMYRVHSAKRIGKSPSPKRVDRAKVYLIASGKEEGVIGAIPRTEDHRVYCPRCEEPQAWIELVNIRKGSWKYFVRCGNCGYSGHEKRADRVLD